MSDASESLAAVALNQIEPLIWKLLQEGATTADSPLRFPVLATAAPKGVDARVLVLRRADIKQRLLEFHTDVRSAKVQQIESVSEVVFVFYDPLRKLQLRVKGGAKPCSNEQAVSATWRDLSVHTKRAYTQERVPGTHVSKIENGAPCPNAEDAELGRVNFAVIECHVHSIEWLVLSRTGHRSALVRSTPEGWSSTWVMP